MSGGCTLLSIVQTYMRDNRMYAMQIVQRTYVGPPDVRYFMGYLLGNTWTYETPFGPLCKDHRMYARVVGRLLLCQRVGGKLSL
jgi:hypothetical protein